MVETVAEDEAIEEAFAADQIEGIVEQVAQDEAAEVAVAEEPKSRPSSRMPSRPKQPRKRPRDETVAETVETVAASARAAEAEAADAVGAIARKTMEEHRGLTIGRALHDDPPISAGSFHSLVSEDASGTRGRDVGTDRRRDPFARLAVPAMAAC